MEHIDHISKETLSTCISKGSTNDSASFTYKIENGSLTIEITKA